MDLNRLEIPLKFEEMKTTYERYFQQLDDEMQRFNNQNFETYIEQYLDALGNLSRRPTSDDVIRTAIGVLALHNLGFPDFPLLSRIFDRIIPQTTTNHVLFTSWVAGRLIHHPNLDQSRYVNHLFDRCLGWIKAHGRRARHLAAAHMLEQLYANAGSGVVIFSHQFQSTIWLLISQPSMQVIQATAAAVSKFTRAAIRYGRSDLQTYLTFFTSMCGRLFSLEAPIKVYAALKVFEQLIINDPDSLLPQFHFFFKLIKEQCSRGIIIIEGAAYTTLAAFVLVDRNQFLINIAPYLIDLLPKILPEYPPEISFSTKAIIEKCPEFFKQHIPMLKKLAEDLMTNDSDSSCQLFSGLLNTYKEQILPLSEEYVEYIINSTPVLTEKMGEFFVAYSDLCSKEHNAMMFNRLIKELKVPEERKEHLIALDILAKMPQKSIIQQEEILCLITQRTSERSIEYRSLIPKTMYHLASSFDSLRTSITKKLFQYAIFDQSSKVRYSILSVLSNNATKDLASPEYMKYIGVFASDGSTDVRIKAFELISKLTDLNPLAMSTITRDSMLEYFFSLESLPDLRVKARIIRSFPNLIKATGATIKIYAPTIIDICSKLLIQPQESTQFANFLEIKASEEIAVGCCQALILTAPVDPNHISIYVEQLIPCLCEHLQVAEKRSVSVASLNLLFVLLSPPTSCMATKGMVPVILTACSKFLNVTRSRKIRMAILKVIGAIGVLEVHQRPQVKLGEPPDFSDDQLSRQFYHPARDNVGDIDDTLLIHAQTTEQCIIAVVSTSLMKIFKDDNLNEFHTDAASALAEILHDPKMSVLAYFDKFITRLLEVIETAPDSEVEVYLPLFSRLVQSTGSNTSPFMNRALEIIGKRYNDQLALPIIDLIISFATSMKDLFVQSSSSTLCLLIHILNTKKCTDEKICLAILRAFSSICEYQNDLSFIIVQTVSDTIACDGTFRSVRIAALRTFDKMARSVDVFKKIGPIVRALEYCLGVDDEETKNSAMNLLSSLILAQGREFLINADPLLDYIKINNLETQQLKDIIKIVTKGHGYATFMPIKQPVILPQRGHTSRMQQQNQLQQQSQHSFSEEAILARVLTPALGYSSQLEQWLHSFVLTTITNNPNTAIRTCSTLASNYRPLAFALFKIAFFTCWKEISEEGKNQISETFQSILTSTENYAPVAKELLNLIFFMRKMNPPISIPSQEIAKACLRYGYDAFALFLQQTKMFNDKTVTPKSVIQLIDIYIAIGEWHNANAVWKKYSNSVPSIKRPETLSKLKMWDEALPKYRERYEKGCTEDFPNVIKSLSLVAQYSEMVNYLGAFRKLDLAGQRKTASYFANAMMHLRKWDELDETLKSAPDDSLRCAALSAISALHNKNFESVDSIINNAFSLLASRPISLWADNLQLNTDTMLVAQQFVEILEMKKWIQDEKLRPAIEDVWAKRLAIAPRDFELWLKLLGNRSAIIGVNDDTYIDFFQLRSLSMDTKIHMNAFNSLFPDFDFKTSTDELARICYVVTNWSTGNQKQAIQDMKQLTQEIEGDFLDRCNTLYASWILETGETLEEFLEAYNHLQSMQAVSDCLIGNEMHRKSSRKISNSTSLFLPKAVVNVLKEDSTNVNVLRMWSDVNIQLITYDPPNIPRYVTNAIDALSQCCILAPNFTDVVQLLNLFFDHANEGNIFQHTTSNCINKLSPKLLLQASSQLLIQLSHPSPEVAIFVHDTIYTLLQEHYHELIFSVIVMKFSRDPGRAQAAFNLFDEFKKMNPLAHDEVFTIRKCLLRAAVTWYEKVMQSITDAFDFYAMQQYDQMVETLRSITTMVKNPKCALHQQFKKNYSSNIVALERILHGFSPLDQNRMGQLTQWCKAMQAMIADELKKTRIIQLSSVSESLANKTHFQLAVPGTYRPEKPIIRIRYFVNQFSVYMSKQQPKDIVIRGEDGNFYQYLVKGHEDLRLDERIQQFFRLINTYLKRETCFNTQVIQTMSVIPLSITNGLVQWVTGTDTLRVVVEQYRRLMQKDPIQEYGLIEKIAYNSFDYLMPIQKLHVIKKVMNIVPDTDIANFFYLKSMTPELWHKKINTFAISAAITSMVGYIIGLGDRHPSNILIDRNTGKVIHIDFGDCFERAAKRKFLPEVVPFRLTRMMVKAMGPTGKDGTFKQAFINTSRVLRENKRVLIMVLAIFVHEPLVDPRERRSGSSNTKDQKSFVGFSDITGSVLDKGRILLNDPSDKTTNTEMRARVNQKLSGMDFDEKNPLSIEDQATLLIKEATDQYNLAKMYSGWCQFW